MPSQTLYEILNINEEATDEEIKRAYRQMALKYHPDKNPNNAEAEARFKEINRAYTILSNPSQRRIYDAYGDAGIDMADEVGEEYFETYLLPSNPCLNCIVLSCFVFSGCGCCCCCCYFCCFNKCCGLFAKPKVRETPQHMADVWNSGDDLPSKRDATWKTTENGNYMRAFRESDGNRVIEIIVNQQPSEADDSSIY